MLSTIIIASSQHVWQATERRGGVILLLQALGAAPSGSGIGGASARQRQLLAQAAELEAREKAGQTRQTSSGEAGPHWGPLPLRTVDARLQGPVSGQFCAPDPHDAGILPSSRPRLR